MAAIPRIAPRGILSISLAQSMYPVEFLPLTSADAALDSLVAIARNFEPAAPDDLRTRIIEVLGDLGIWPIDCLMAQWDTIPRLVA